MTSTTQHKPWIRRLYPFNAEQTVNILSEFGPLVTLFVVNAVYGITAGIWSLIGTTILSLIVMWIVLKRLPMFALIAGGITLVFSVVALYTEDPMWVQLKVTLFNAVFAVFLMVGLATKQNFFKYSFGKTFHYSDEGWRKFTWSFVYLFLFLAAANEAVRIGFYCTQTGEHTCKETYNLFGWHSDGLNIWVMFKVAVVMPLTAVYAWFMTRLMQKYRIDEPIAGGAHAAGTALGGAGAPKTSAAGVGRSISGAAVHGGQS